MSVPLPHQENHRVTVRINIAHVCLMVSHQPLRDDLDLDGKD